MSGIPPGRFIPDRSEDMSGAAVELLSSAPPRGIAPHVDCVIDFFVMKLRLWNEDLASVEAQDRTVSRIAEDFIVATVHSQ